VALLQNAINKARTCQDHARTDNQPDSLWLPINLYLDNKAASEDRLVVVSVLIGL
jgi:hypothetical protein